MKKRSYSNRDSIFSNAKFVSRPRKIIYNPSSPPILKWDLDNPDWLYGAIDYNVFPKRNSAFTTVILDDGTQVCLSHSLGTDGDIEIEMFERFKENCSLGINPRPLETGSLKFKDHINHYSKWQVVFVLPSSNLETPDWSVPHMRIVACSLNAYLKYYENGIPCKSFSIVDLLIDRISMGNSAQNVPGVIMALQNKDDYEEIITLVVRIHFPHDSFSKTHHALRWIFENCQGNLAINNVDSIFMDSTDEFCYMSDFKNSCNGG